MGYSKVVDMSAWQENVDWNAIVNNGITGVILKIGEGTRMDSMFATHVNNAIAHGLNYGIYYYAHGKNANQGKEEADRVDNWCKQWLSIKTPPLGIWYDAEDNSMLGYTNPAYACAYFIDRLLQKDHNYCGIYTSYNWATNVIDLSILPDYIPFWVAQYGYYECSFAVEHPERIVKIWQYTDSEPIGNMYLDCNYYYDNEYKKDAM